MLEQQDLAFISKLSVFAGLDPEVLSLIGQLSERVDRESGGILFREGEPATEMVVVLSGRLDVIKRAPNGDEACIATLGAGDLAGEMSLIDIQPRSAEVRCAENTSIVVLTHANIAKVYDQDPNAYLLLVRNIAREISLRLRRLDELLATMIHEIRKTGGNL